MRVKAALLTCALPALSLGLATSAQALPDTTQIGTWWTGHAYCGGTSLQAAYTNQISGGNLYTRASGAAVHTAYGYVRQITVTEWAGATKQGSGVTYTFSGSTTDQVLTNIPTSYLPWIYNNQFGGLTAQVTVKDSNNNVCGPGIFAIGSA